MKLYACDFLILATGENNEGHIPKVGGLENFKGGRIHSNDYQFSKNMNIKKYLLLDLEILVWKLVLIFQIIEDTHQLLLEVQ